MKKVCFSIFAHPDDEAFGPSGTLLKMAHSGTDIYLICATSGGNGVNLDGHADLGVVRLEEWRTSGQLIGATGMNYLGYADGELNNNSFHTIAAEIHNYISKTISSYEEPVEVSFITFDINGISGHIDHIVMSMVTSYVYYQLKDQSPNKNIYKELRYFCICEATAPTPNTSYLFMPQGRSNEEIDIIEDISSVAEEKRAVMCAHHSQRQDAETILKRKETLLQEHYYLAT